MKISLARRMEHLPQQFFASLVAKVQDAIALGHDVINLGQGNPDLPTPPHIVEALRVAVLDSQTHRYPPFRGLISLKQEVAEFYLQEYGVELDPTREIAILFGGKTGLVELSQIYLNPGDVALVPNPGYPDYWSGVALAEADMVTFDLLEENEFLPRLDDISREAWQKAKLMFLNYPNNPTGAVANATFFAEVVQRAGNHEVMVVHDFAYGAIGFDGAKPLSFLQTPGAKDVGIELYTMSKTYNMAGWRIAFALGNADVIGAIELLQDHYYVSLFPAVQRAAQTALAENQASVRELVGTYQERRDAFVGELHSSGIRCKAPQGSFFVWMTVPEGYTSVAFADFLLQEAHVAVAPGVGFGTAGEGYVRIGLLADVHRLQEAAKRIVEAIAAHPLNS